MISKEKVIIVGGGLSGLTLAYLLQKKGIGTTLLEASTRLGGRIQTVKGSRGTPLELGATWFADKHQSLTFLVDELGIKKFPQYSKGITLFQTKSFEPPQQFFVPEAEQPSYRIAGGTQTITDALAEKLTTTNIRLNAKVTAISANGSGVKVELADGEVVEGNKAIVCIPPQLAAAQIQFSPQLPANVQGILPTVQTWMAGAIKFTLEYGELFWRKKGFSGMLYSHADIVVEMYDHTNFEEDKYGFTGFPNGGAAGFSMEVRKANVLRQLSELFGAEAGQPTAYYDKVWNDEYLVKGNALIERPHQNNGHPLLQMDYLDGKLLFCGTETATEFPGYMEGAVDAAIRVANKF
ncbi:MAG: flavin monoamine oxidase family protein [Ilyomonas sp.]